MKTGKEVILDYCNKILNKVSVETVQACEDIKNGLEKGTTDFMPEHCPSNYGLDDFTGDCELTNVGNDWKEINQQCLKCWDRALNTIS